MVLIPTTIVSNEIEIFGELVTLTTKSAKTYSDWGDGKATETEIEDVKAVYNVYENSYSQEMEGKMKIGQITFFFKPDQTGIEYGTSVTRTNGEVYEIKDVRDHGIQGSSYVKEAIVEKV
jgi:hypothetical protein